MKLITHQEMYQKACAQMEDWYPHLNEVVDGCARCLYWMHVTCAVLSKAGIGCVPCAGSASFLIVPPELDDGVSPTHFSFMWETPPGGVMRTLADSIAKGKQVTALPEMHCWNYLPATQEIVDFSAGTIPAMAERMGFKWQTPKLPPFLWRRPTSLLPAAIYTPNRDAAQLAMRIIRSGQ